MRDQTAIRDQSDKKYDGDDGDDGNEKNKPPKQSSSRRFGLEAAVSRSTGRSGVHLFFTCHGQRRCHNHISSKQISSHATLIDKHRLVATKDRLIDI